MLVIVALYGSMGGLIFVIAIRRYEKDVYKRQLEDDRMRDPDGSELAVRAFHIL